MSFVLPTNQNPINRHKDDGVLHITHVLESVSPSQGGTLTSTLDLCVALKDRGNRVSLAIVGPNADAKDASTLEIDVIFATLPSSIRLTNPLREILKQSHVVHLHTPWSLRNISIARFLKKQRIPYVVTTHGMLDRWSLKQKPLKKHLFLNLFGKRFLRNAQAVHCTAESEKVQVLECDQLLRDRVCVAPCLFDAKDYLPLVDLRTIRHIPEILFLSRLHPKKGCEILIDAAKLLRDRGRTFTVSIVGPSDPFYLDWLIAKTQRLQLTEIIKFSGMKLGRHKIDCYQNADIFALPTYQENFGLVLVEAMASGLPVVTTRNTDIWCELESGGARIVENTPEVFASSLEALILDQKTRLNVGRQGSNHIAKWLDCDRTVRRYKEMYLVAIENS